MPVGMGFVGSPPHLKRATKPLSGHALRLRGVPQCCRRGCCFARNPPFFVVCILIYYMLHSLNQKWESWDIVHIKNDCGRLQNFAQFFKYVVKRKSP